MYLSYTQSLRAVLPCTHEKILVFNSGFPKLALSLLVKYGTTACLIVIKNPRFYIKKKTLICRVFFIGRAFKLRIQQRILQSLSLLLNPLSILRPSAQQLLL